MSATLSIIWSVPKDTFLTQIIHGFEKYKTMRKRQKASQSMCGIDRQTLKDIGIGRSEIMSIVYGTTDAPLHRASQ